MECLMFYDINDIVKILSVCCCFFECRLTNNINILGQGC